MTIHPISASALAAEHRALFAAEHSAWARAEAVLDGSPGYPDAVKRWTDAKLALDAFVARLAELRTQDPEIIRLKARALAAAHGGRAHALDDAIEAALSEAKEGDHVADVALAMSIARDLLAA